MSALSLLPFLECEAAYSEQTVIELGKIRNSPVRRLRLLPMSNILEVAHGTGEAAATTMFVTTRTSDAPQIPLWRKAEGMLVSSHEQHATVSTGLETLPLRSESFDAVISLFAVSAVARPDILQAELLRVCRPGGRLLMANWTPGGFVGHILRLVSQHTSPSLYAPSAPLTVLWGDEFALTERLGGLVKRLKFQRKMAVISFPCAPDEVVSILCVRHASVKRTFLALTVERQFEFTVKMTEILTRHNLAADGSTKVAAEYLVVTAIRI